MEKGREERITIENTYTCVARERKKERKRERERERERVERIG